MTGQEYIKNATRTEKVKSSWDNEIVPARMEHAILGIGTEAGELLTALKNSKIYDKKFDAVNMLEELGDLTWYIAIALDTLGLSWEEVWERNIAKLKARYPEKYSNELALKRNLDEERAILEGRGGY